MARPRFAGATSFMRAPSMKRSPLVISSRPATRRSSVDLPQPEGPTKTTNSRSSMASETPLITSTSPKRFLILSSWTVAIVPVSLALLHRAEREPAHELPLAQPAEDEDGRDGHGGGRRELRPEEPLGAREGGDEGGERRRPDGGQVEAPER